MRGGLGAEKSDLEHEALLSRMGDEIALFGTRVVGPATREAVSAFREKRRPDFSMCD